MDKNDRPSDAPETETTDPVSTTEDVPCTACPTGSSVTSSKESSIVPMLTADRHQGWHTEFTADPAVKLGRARRATDYVVQTSFVTGPSHEQKNRNADRKRVNLVVRFRSLLSRRALARSTPDTKHHRAHKLLLGILDEKANRLGQAERNTTFPKSPTQGRPQDFRSDPGALFKRSRSDSFLRRTCHPQIEPENGTSQTVESTAGDTTDSGISTEQKQSKETMDDISKRMQSLSTGNICCLYALRCEPSVEYLSVPLNHHSPRPRRRSLPVSSLKYTSGTDAEPDRHLALTHLKEHPCFQDVHVKLNDWVQEAMNHPSESNIEGTPLLSFNNDQDSISRHVRFADEACSSSATTLNSLSASSSLCSLNFASASRSPVDSSNQLTSPAFGPYGTLLKPPPAHLTRPKSPIPRLSRRFFRKVLRDKTKISGEGGSSIELSSLGSDLDLNKLQSHYRDKSSSVAQRLWHKKKSKRQRDQKDTPFLTVNVIKDHSEPPEVPRHVFSELHLEEEQPRWKNLFANPDECSTFNQRLAKQQVCLGRLLSTGLSNIESIVHVVAPSPFLNLSPFEVRLRYTLNNWATNADSPPLTKMCIEKRNLSTCESQWIETYRGVLDIPVDSLPESKWIAEFGQFEFAVVARRDGSELWDNNDEQNYICFRESSED